MPLILAHGADWYAAVGHGEERRARSSSASAGHVKRPGLYELPLGTPLRVLIDDTAAGCATGKTAQGGDPGRLLGAAAAAGTLDSPMDFESMAEAGSMLGSGGVIVIDEETCMVDALRNLLRFYAHESCGQCTPCREGCNWM